MSFGKSKIERRNALNEMIQIAPGQQHTMILKKDGSIYSWGLGLSGQLGVTYEQIQENDVTIAQ